MNVPDRYTLENLREGFKNPKKLLQEFYRITTNRGMYLHRLIEKPIFSKRFGEGIDFMEKDWDNLIILDACRSDYFEAVNDLDGTSTFVVSKASQSQEFCQKTFVGREFHDTVYVTANAYGARVESDVFHDLIPAFGTNSPAHHRQYLEPEGVSELANEAAGTYPNKRLIVHYMQPHSPYFGETANSLRDRLFSENIRVKDWGSGDTSLSDGDRYVTNLMNAAMKEYISPGELRKVYGENLRHVLPHVEGVIDDLGGKSIITTGHGELLGEPASIFTSHRFHHKPELYTNELRLVPWFVINGDERRTISVEEPVESVELGEEDIEKQLEALGYK